MAIGTIDEYNYLSKIFSPDNNKELTELQKRLARAMQTELTECQLKYMKLYYWNGWSMEAIGKKYGVDKSTVSRTIKRGRARLRRVLRYTSEYFMR